MLTHWPERPPHASLTTHRLLLQVQRNVNNMKARESKLLKALDAAKRKSEHARIPLLESDLSTARYVCMSGTENDIILYASKLYLSLCYGLSS